MLSEIAAPSGLKRLHCHARFLGGLRDMRNAVMIAECSRIKRPKCSQQAASPIYGCVPAPELMAAVQKRSRPFQLPADRTVFREGDPPNGIFFVRSGNVALSIRSAGRTALRMRAEAGSVIGLPSTVSDKPYSISAQASKGAEIDRLSPESYRELLEGDPKLSVEVLKILASEIRAVRRTLIAA